MRVASWNVNSLKARLQKVCWWLERARPDVLLLQETKLSDEAAPGEEFGRYGYELVHYGEGRWNGVAIASRVGIQDVIKNFAEPVASSEARMVSAVCGYVRVINIYAPNGRQVGSEFYQLKLRWFERLARFLHETRRPEEDIVLGGDFNVAPADADVWDPEAFRGSTHVSADERAAFQRLLDWGMVDAYRLKHTEPYRYTWWDYRGGAFHKNFGMRIDHLLVSDPLSSRVVDSEIDREARKGKPIPSDHSPLFIDLDEPGKTLDAGWARVDARVAQ